MAAYQILAWYGIPTGVKAQDEAGEARESLPHRFQAAADAAATATGRIGTKAYLAGWQWSAPLHRPGSARTVAQSVVNEMLEAYPPERIKELRRALERELDPD